MIYLSFFNYSSVRLLFFKFIYLILLFADNRTLRQQTYSNLRHITFILFSISEYFIQKFNGNVRLRLYVL